MTEKSLAKKAVQAVIASRKAFCKFLSANDTGKTGGHQAGIYVPKSALSILFDTACERGKNFDRRVKLRWQDEVAIECRFVYYGAKTRNEYRITNCSSKEFNPLAEENTGALAVLIQEDYETYGGWILNTDFPQAEVMSQAARQIHEQIFNHAEHVIEKPDQKLIQWIVTEYKLFRAIEESRYGKQIRCGFANMQDFLELANSILNRRKSRAGKSLEYHLAAIFDGNNLLYDWQLVTEGNKCPDFIFPRGAYHNLNYDTNKLIVLAAKCIRNELCSSSRNRISKNIRKNFVQKFSACRSSLRSLRKIHFEVHHLGDFATDGSNEIRQVLSGKFRRRLNTLTSLSKIPARR